MKRKISLLATFVFISVMLFSGMTVSANGPFEDVSETDASSAAIGTLKDAGIVLGSGTGKFYPSNTLKKGELALMLTRAFLKDKGETNNAAKAIELCVSAGYLEKSAAVDQVSVRDLAAATATVLINKVGYVPTYMDEALYYAPKYGYTPNSDKKAALVGAAVRYNLIGASTSGYSSKATRAQAAVTVKNLIDRTSNVQDAAKPAKSIDDLGITRLSDTSAKLTFSAPCDSDGTKVEKYDIRYSEYPLSDATFRLGTKVDAEIVPQEPYTAEAVTVNDLKKDVRYWFSVRSFDGYSWSEVSNTAATIAKLPEGIQTAMFFQDSVNTRNTDIIRAYQPDYVERGLFEWIGTSLIDTKFASVKHNLDRLHLDGIAVGGGCASDYWQRDRETLGPNVNPAELTLKVEGQLTDSLAAGTSAENQLIFKAKKSIEYGADGYEYDSPTRIPKDYKRIAEEVRKFLKSIGRNALVYGNGGLGGYEDFNTTNYPALRDDAPYNGGTDSMSYLQNKYSEGKNFGTVHMLDWETGDQVKWPNDPATWPQAYRHLGAQIVASGNYPGQGKGYFNTNDAYNAGVYGINVNYMKFMRENPQIIGLNARNDVMDYGMITFNKDWMWSIGYNTGSNVIVHVVNGNYDMDKLAVVPQDGVKATVDVGSKKILRAWTTSPDRPFNKRIKELSFKQTGSTVEVNIPNIDYYEVVVLETGAEIHPIYNPAEIVFPFPNPEVLYSTSSIKLSALETEGFLQTFDWYVNGIKNGNDTVGKIVNGYYYAPSVTSDMEVTITAKSQDVTALENSFEFTVRQAFSGTYKETFEGVADGFAPKNWLIPDGRGAFEVNTENGVKTLSDPNWFDGVLDGGATNWSALAVTGRNDKDNYKLEFELRQDSVPHYWYSSVNDGVFASAVFGYKDGGNYLEYRITTTNKVQLVECKNGVYTVLSEKAFTSPVKGQWYKVSLNVSGGTTTFSVNGKAVDSYRVPYTKGSCGVGTSFILNTYKNISITY